MALGNKTLDDLLAPISQQLGNVGVADSVELPEWEFKPARVTDGVTGDALVDVFAGEAEKIRVAVSRCSKEGLADCLAGIVGEGIPETGEPCEVVCAADARFEQAGVYDAVKSASAVKSLTVWNESRGRSNVDAALTATFGITYAACGIAETGTVVQPTSATCGRAVSLLPLVHVAVVDASAIVPTMLEVMKSFEAKGGKLPSQVCFISGPSATADIELVRVEGVHGPMYVHYVIVE